MLSFLISEQRCERVATAPARRLAPDLFDVAVRAGTDLALSSQPEFTHEISSHPQEELLGYAIIIAVEKNAAKTQNAALKSRLPR